MAASDEQSSDERPFGDRRDAICERARAASLSYEIEEWSSDEDHPDSRVLRLDLPNGRLKRSLLVDQYNADRVAAANFEALVVVGDYQALFDRSRNTLEVLLQAPSNDLLSTPTIVRLPGVEIFSRSLDGHSADDLVGSFLDIPIVEGTTRLGQVIGKNARLTWCLPVADAPGETSVEISPSSATFKAMFGRSQRSNREITLKVGGVKYDTHDTTLALLEDYANSLLFDIDVRFGITIVLARKPRAQRGFMKRRNHESTHPLQFPQVHYSHQATTLYFYGKSSTEMPLLQYLSYYQAIEHHFSRFFEKDLTARVRNHIRDPRFDASSDDRVRRLISLASRAGRTTAREREQLQATLSGSLDTTELVEFLEADADLAKFLATKDRLAGVPTIKLPARSRGRDLSTILSQLTERIYAIRCRIVHAKDDTADTYAAPLIPYSAEVALLQQDLKLIEYVCQKVIIAGATS